MKVTKIDLQNDRDKKNRAKKTSTCLTFYMCLNKRQGSIPEKYFTVISVKPAVSLQDQFNQMFRKQNQRNSVIWQCC